MKRKTPTAMPQHTTTPSNTSEAREVPRMALTIKEFCEAHSICEAFYYKLRAAGLGPREMRALSKITISVEAAAEWRRARENASPATADAEQD
jgi:hypothetical protein